MTNNHSENMLARLLSQFRDDNSREPFDPDVATAPGNMNINRLMWIFGNELDTLEAIFENLRDDTTLETAAGVWLDVIGDIIGLERPHREQPTATIFACKPTEADVDDPYKAFDNAGTGGYFQTRKGLEYLADPTEKKTDSEYRKMIQAKIQANIADGTVPDIYNYLVTGRELDGDLTIDTVVGRADVSIVPSDVFTQLERYLLDLIGPHSAGTEIYVKNWTLEHYHYTWYLRNPSRWTISQDTVDGDLTKTLLVNHASGDLCSLPKEYFSITATEASYGEWEIWIKKDPASIIRFFPIAYVDADAGDLTQRGYYLELAANESANFFRDDSGFSTSLFTTAVSTATPSVWQKWTITRDDNEEFEVKLNDVALTAVTGTNPVTDATYTLGHYQVISADQNDEFALSTMEDVRK
jgi:hypothetical protein